MEVAVFIEEKIGRKNIDESFTRSELGEMFIEFAKYHVKKALQEAYNASYVNPKCNNCSEYHDNAVNKESILNVYPLNNIF